jgi:hypothetical protein
VTRGELRARISGEIERHGHASVPSSELWAAFSAPGEDPSLSFDDALRGFAAYNGWSVRRDDLAAADAFIFRPHSKTLAGEGGGPI